MYVFDRNYNPCICQPVTWLMKHQQQPIQQVLFLPLFIFLFMSPDPKGEVSFSHKLVPIVVHLASTISKSSLKTLGQFQLKLV